MMDEGIYEWMDEWMNGWMEQWKEREEFNVVFLGEDFSGIFIFPHLTFISLFLLCFSLSTYYYQMYETFFCC